jgi:SAM-dependent methyltransferase
VSSGSIRFDRAAEYYDRTRGLPPEAMAQVVSVLAPELAPRGRCLEIGVGTGRIALPLAAAGVRMFGIDLSEPMLRKLLEKSRVVPVAMADATVLPFRDGTFGAGLAVHVLHLIPNWRGAVREMARVVRPRGAILIDLGGWAEDHTRDVERQFEAETGVPERFVGLGQDSAGELDAELAKVGASPPRLLSVEVERRALSLDQHVQELEDGLFSWTWEIDEGVRRRAGRAVREWAAERFGSLDEPRPVRGRMTWRAYDLP